MFTGISYIYKGAEHEGYGVETSHGKYKAMKLRPIHSYALVLDIITVLGTVGTSLLSKQFGIPVNVKYFLLGAALGYSIPLAFIINKHVAVRCRSGYHYFP